MRVKRRKREKWRSISPQILFLGPSPLILLPLDGARDKCERVAGGRSRSYEERNRPLRSAQQALVTCFAAEPRAFSRGERLADARGRMSVMELMAELTAVRRHPTEVVAVASPQYEQSAHGLLMSRESLFARASFSSEPSFRGHAELSGRAAQNLENISNSFNGAFAKTQDRDCPGRRFRRPAGIIKRPRQAEQCEGDLVRFRQHLCLLTVINTRGC